MPQVPQGASTARELRWPGFRRRRPRRAAVSALATIPRARWARGRRALQAGRGVRGDRRDARLAAGAPPELGISGCALEVVVRVIKLSTKHAPNLTISLNERLFPGRSLNIPECVMIRRHQSCRQTSRQPRHRAESWSPWPERVPRDGGRSDVIRPPHPRGPFDERPGPAWEPAPGGAGARGPASKAREG